MRRARWALLAVVSALALALASLSGVASALTPTETLKQPPFPPTDVSLFAQDTYPNGPAMVPAGQTANDEATLRKQLKALLVKRFGTGSTQVGQGLAKFDAASTKKIVPHPRLRAALVALKGTVGDAVINGALNGTYGSVAFVPLPEEIAAQVQGLPDGLSSTRSTVTRTSGSWHPSSPTRRYTATRTSPIRRS